PASSCPAQGAHARAFAGKTRTLHHVPKSSVSNYVTSARDVNESRAGKNPAVLVVSPAAGVGNEERLTMPARTPEDCDRLFGEHVNAREVEAVVALYEEDGRFVQRDGSVAAGRPEIRKAIA